MPFSPADVGNLYAWWKADSLALSDGDAIGTWTDSSASGFDATQGTAAAKPTYKTNIVNSLPVARFDGGDSLASSASASLAASTFFAVFRPANGDLRSMLVASASGGIEWRQYSGGQNILVRETAEIATGTTALSTSVFQVLAVTFASASSYAMYFNGAPDGSGSHAQTLTAGRTMNIGGPFDIVTADFAELIMYDAVLSTSSRHEVTAYLGAKYGVAVQVPPILVLPPRRP